MSDPLIAARAVSKTYDRAGAKIDVLKSIDLEVYQGEALCILGASGAGKSTLLHILGALDRATSGHVLFRGQDLQKMSEDELADFRNRELGFVFQFHHLLSEFSALENVMLPARIAGASESEASQRAKELLQLLGLESRLHHFPSELSGGEQQRVSVARALVQKPKVLLADEPTGNLDTENSRQLQELIFQLKLRWNFTLIVVTHDSQFAGRFPRRLTLKDGQWN
jgi:lipoprotein-releasing system ATP-binding protein